MIKKIVAHGNSAALIIDKPILQPLNVNEGTPLEITTDGRKLIIWPIEEEKRKTRYKAALEKSNKVYGKTLKKLAE